jgi:hypothetical protein
MAGPTVFNAVATNPGGTGSTLTVTLSTHAANDLLILYVANTGNVLWTGNPTGWSRIDQRTVGTSSNGIVGTWLWRKVLPGDSLPLANPVCTLGATVTRLATCRTIRGADLESPFVTPNYGQRGFSTGTANPIRPPTVVTPVPEILALHCYGARAATNAPDPSGYTQDAEAVVSGTLVINAGSQAIADQNTSLSNQDASPTSGARWASGVICIPGTDYPYYRTGAQATTASGTSVTPTKPTGTTNSDVNGNADVMIATVEGAGSTTLSAADSGLWTEIGGVWSGTTSGGGSSVKKFWCYATVSPNMQFNRTGTGEISACITTYYNCRQTAALGTFDADARASSTTSTWDALSRSYSHSLVQATCVADATPTFTAPAGWSERMDGLGITCADQTFNAVGSAASASFTLSTASPTLVGLVEIKSPTGVGAIDLVVQDAAHAHAAGSVVLAQVHELAVNSAAHSHSATSITLAQVHALVVQDSTHAHLIVGPALTQVHELVVVDGTHQHAAESVTLAIILGVADTTHEHAANSVSLTQTHLLIVSDVNHGHEAENVNVSVTIALETQDATHAHVADNVTLVQAHSLLIAGSAHNHVVDSVLLAQAHVLDVANGIHEQAVESLTLTQMHALTVESTVHPQTAINLTLGQSHFLTIQNAIHAQVAETPTIGAEGDLIVASSTHAQLGDNLTITQAHGLVVTDAAHAHFADDLTLAVFINLTAQSAIHVHLGENIALGVSAATLVIADSYHVHTATSIPSLSVDLTAQPTAIITVVSDHSAVIVVQSKPNAVISKWQ